MTAKVQLADVLSEFARTMVTDFPIQAILDRLVERIVDVLPVSAAGVTLIAASVAPPHYIAASNAMALELEQLQSRLSEGPCLAAYRTDSAVLVADLAIDERFQGFAPPALAAGLGAVFAFPLRHGRFNALGALDLYRDEPGPLSEEAINAAQTLADVAAAYILNAQARQDLKTASDLFRENSLHDSLTGLPNRVLFGQLIEHAVSRTQRSGKQLAVLFVDLDRFKEINDVYGHQAGDELLIAVAERLTDLLRTGDTMARLAGDEFVILCEDLDEAFHVEQLANRIDAGMNHPFMVSGHEMRMTASVGIAYSGGGDAVPERILHDADTAMYQAKRRGGASHQVLDLREQAQTQSLTTLSLDLRGALARGELRAYYQPVVAAETGLMVGVETLARWLHPARGMISPSLFIPLAEESHLICAIGRWMLEQACRSRQTWVSNYGLDENFRLAVNVSTHELLGCSYAAMVAEVLDAADTNPESLTVEITESVMIKDPERALVILTKLKDLGVKLALDDFGTGYSSLGYLHDFPVDTVKIDRSFIHTLGTDEASDSIVAAIINLAHTLNMTVVAEGMETLEQAEKIVAFGCELCQGYYFSKPLAPGAIDRLLRENGSGELYLPIIGPQDATSH